MNIRRTKRAAASLVAAGALAGATVGLTTAPSLASTKGAVSGYVFAWRQMKGASQRSVLVAYRAKNNTTGAVKSASCTLRAKPTVKIAKPGYYSFSPQKFSLANASAKFTYIGIFTLPHTHITVLKMWVTCS